MVQNKEYISKLATILVPNIKKSHKHLHPIIFKHTHREAVGFRSNPTVSCDEYPCRSRSEERCSGSNIEFPHCASTV